MIRKWAAGVLVILVGIGFAAADEFDAIVKKVEGGKVKYQKVILDDKGEVNMIYKLVLTASTAKDLKVVMGKYNETDKKWDVDKAIEGGLDAEIFKNASAKTIHARITRTDDGKAINQILVRKLGGAVRIK